MRKKNLSNTFIKLTFSQSLVKLMKQKPYNEISIIDICNTACFGRSTFYRHFSNNKDDLLYFICDYYWQAYKQAHKDEVEKDEAKALLNHIYNNKDFFLLLKKNNLLYLFYNIFYELMKPKNVNYDKASYIYSFFLGAYYGIIVKWLESDMDLTPIELENVLKSNIEYLIKTNKSNNI